MKALIDAAGRIAQIQAETFPVAAPFFWVDCEDSTDPRTQYFDGKEIAKILAQAETPRQTNERLTRSVQAYMDSAALKLGYSSICSACTYADEPAVQKFQKEGQALRAWRSAVWQAFYQILSQIQAEAVTPTESELIARLPNFVGP